MEEKVTMHYYYHKNSQRKEVVVEEKIMENYREILGTRVCVCTAIWYAYTEHFAIMQIPDISFSLEH